MRKDTIGAIMPGVLLCFFIALPAWALGRMFPIIGGPILAILTGILLSSLFPKRVAAGSKLETGIGYTAKKLLQYSIILLGFEMNLFHVLEVGRQSLFVMLFTLSAAFLTAFFLGKILKLPGNTSTLIGVGSSICGGSAIAATSPVIQAKEEEIARAISTIFLFNIIAVFIFPALGHLLGMNDYSFGMWAGTAINDTSSVVAAGTAWSNSSGNSTALQFATIVKLTRTLMIVPITLFLALYTSRKQQATQKSDVHILRVFPFFVLFFILAAIINTFAGLPVELTQNLAFLGEFMIVMAMAAIGLKTDLTSLLSNGVKPILLGLACWFAVAVTGLAVQRFLGI